MTYKSYASEPFMSPITAQDATDSPASAGHQPTSPAVPIDISGSRNLNPAGMTLWQLWREDYHTHGRKLFDQGFWSVAVHRFGNWRMGIKWKLVRMPFTLLYNVSFKLVEILTGITLPYTCRLGRRVHVWHHSGIIISAYAIGDDVHLRQSTTMGVVRRDENADIPIIEDRVDIGCGVCILGGVRVGHDSVIGANAVVLEDVPPHSIAVGIPARVIPKKKAASDD
ncbi:serine O-acetyltransferase [Aeoliella mucimassa]|uniref:Serine acetyltransferase n=1 Tax=Aeoliella mucimassa TaxID=2527972 RepID=A0A518AK47_9BACT|nr:serine acetyltransferase [Aeoliella mucimassa]QDU55054.1 Serine acetyltransferase [Aeoliella mucimassa]